MNIYEGSLRKLSHAAWFRWVLARVLMPLDMRLRNTPFAPSKMGVDFPLCFVTTTGRRSGKPRVVPLFCIDTEQGPVVVATNFGTPHHPGWSYNLDADPAAIVEIAAELFEATAHRLSDTEAEEIWPKFEEFWPAYEDYRQIAPRDIKMYVLQPA